MCSCKYFYFIDFIYCYFYCHQLVTLFEICSVKYYKTFRTIPLLYFLFPSYCLVQTLKMFDFTSWRGPPECTISFILWLDHLIFGKSCSLSLNFRSSERPTFVKHILWKIQPLNWVRAILTCLAFISHCCTLLTSVQSEMSRNCCAFLHVGMLHNPSSKETNLRWDCCKIAS